MANPELKIKTEFQNLIRPLTQEEYNLLEDSLKDSGCREPITILEDGTIIDGHNRYKICQEHNIKYSKFVQKGLESETDVKLWMLYNQIGKRNYTNFDKSLVAIEIEKLESIKAKERMLKLSNLKQFQELEEQNDLPARSDLTEREKSGKALEKAAKSVGVGYGTVYKTKQILDKAPEEVIEKVRKGEVSIDRAYQKLQRAERLEQNKQAEWPKGKFRIFYADPPWKYGDERSGMGGAVDQYSLMDLEDIKSMPVAELAEDNAVLFMWGTAPLMREAFEVMDGWGFQYKTNIIWNKVRPNLGNYTSVRHELLFIATKGSCTPDTNIRPNSVQTIERTGRHSEKPEEFRQIVESLYTYGNKIELFARKQSTGWEVYGNEIK